MIRSRLAGVLVGGLVLLLGACTSPPTADDRRRNADVLASRQGWHVMRLTAEPFELTAYLPPATGPAEHLTIYIEGDGLAWIAPDIPSADPTPIHPVALELALAHPEGKAAYLARPCQYGDAAGAGCAPRYWTTHRFAPEVITSSGAAIDALKRQFGARRLTLVGYSGGGAVAALVAARRSDVDALVTVAGNLDHRAWTELHRLPPLTGSLNPADEIDTLRTTRQWHFVGGRDANVPPGLVARYAARFPASQRPHVHIEAGFEHRCCWTDNWTRLWRLARGQ